MDTTNKVDPIFEIRPCDCGGKCGSIQFIMYNPQLLEVHDSQKAEYGEIASMVPFPAAHVEELIARLRELAKGA